MRWWLLAAGEYRLYWIFFFGVLIFFFHLASLLSTLRYGGTLLGPARFSHIETCATEVCKAYKKSEELQDCITTLRTLDDLLLAHREQLSSLTATMTENDASNPSASSAPSNEPSSPPSSQRREAKQVDYKNLDVTKAKRLIQARENSIKSVKAMITKKSKPD